jgi:3-methyladenine DNA glycosylase AlkC
MEPLKEMFNKIFYENLAREFQKAYRNFDPKKFTADVTKDLSSMELNQRMRNTSVVLKKHLPSDYKRSLEIMKKVIPELDNGYTQLVFPDLVSLYGLENFDVSLEALKHFTAFGSSEFAIRVFLKADFDKTIKVMHGWAKDKNHHVRRLASEGSRPRLPWSFKLDRVIENPKLTLPILEILKQDEELYVRKSVANHLNDISKEHPNVMLSVIKDWKGKSKHTDWILKHASRTLLKQGNVNVLWHFGIKHNNDVETSGFKIQNKKVKTGESVEFSFTLKNKGNKKVKVRIEYAVYFRIAGEKLSKKVFKISERELEKQGSLDFSRKHSFKIISTRKYYPGIQKVSLIINGRETEPLEFTLK